MSDPEKLDMTGDNPSQNRAAQTVDRAVLGTSPQTARVRTILFVAAFIIAFGTLFYVLNNQ